MDFESIDIQIGQAIRKRTHVKRFFDALKNPGAVQRAKLQAIISANKNTAFGRDHKFESVHDLETFQKHVPANDYEYFRPYIDKGLAGQTNQLTAEDPFMYATTSGTTDKPKFVPITPGHLNDYTNAFQIHNYHLIKSYKQAASGRFLIIVSNDEEGRVECGLPYGAVSGLLNRRQSAIIRRHFAMPFEICKIKNVDSKYYMMLRAALGENVTAALGCNPSSLLLLADKLKEYAEELIADLADGTIKKEFRPQGELGQAFEKYERPRKARAQELLRILERDGVLLPRTVWPNLSVLSCWKGGPMAFYLEQLPEFYGDTPVRDFGYMASEGRGSIPISDEGAGGVLAVTSHFFEFVSESDMEGNNPRYLTVEDLEKGGRYYIFFTTAGGLYRYNINDLVEVVDFVHSTPVIEFKRKGLGVSSITGEKLTEEQVLVAVRQAANGLDRADLSHFTAEVELGYPPY
ncbi:MAG: GH3 auxin-responsive promoter family protein, partial [Candidatus Obscuribacterales bacterium]|nr:GH3 auxin-responsive promoter family protein [Candidatus Obscuribacterales bacterium]